MPYRCDINKNKKNKITCVYNKHFGYPTAEICKLLCAEYGSTEEYINILRYIKLYTEEKMLRPPMPNAFIIHMTKKHPIELMKASFASGSMFKIVKLFQFLNISCIYSFNVLYMVLIHKNNIPYKPPFLDEIYFKEVTDDTGQHYMPYTYSELKYEYRPQKNIEIIYLSAIKHAMSLIINHNRQWVLFNEPACSQDLKKQFSKFITELIMPKLPDYKLHWTADYGSAYLQDSYVEKDIYCVVWRTMIELFVVVNAMNDIPVLLQLFVNLNTKSQNTLRLFIYFISFELNQSEIIKKHIDKQYEENTKNMNIRVMLSDALGDTLDAHNQLWSSLPDYLRLELGYLNMGFIEYMSKLNNKDYNDSGIDGFIYTKMVIDILAAITLRLRQIAYTPWTKLQKWDSINILRDEYANWMKNTLDDIKVAPTDIECTIL